MNDSSPPRRPDPQGPWWQDKTKDSDGRRDHLQMGREPPPLPNWNAPRLDSVGPSYDAHHGRLASASLAQNAAQERYRRPHGRIPLRWLLIGGGALILAAEGVTLILGINQLGLFGGNQLDVAKVQAGVQRILSDPVYGYGSHTVTMVSCNEGHNPSADKGDSFTCAVTVDGSARRVTVVVDDDDGTYLVDRPK